MSQENVEIVLDQYAARNERDFSRAMAHCDADVALVVPAGFIDPGTRTKVVTRWARGSEIGSEASTATPGSS